MFCANATILFEFEAAIQALVLIFDQQKEERKETDDEETDYGQNYGPGWNAALDNACRAATRTHDLARDGHHLRLWLLVACRRVISAVRGVLRRRHRRDIAGRWSLLFACERR